MSQLLPYVGAGVLLFAFLALWARQKIATRRGHVELCMPTQTPSGMRTATRPRHLGERIFGAQDWDFVRRETALEIQRMFERERSALAISWLRRTRRQVSLVMRTHRAGVRASKSLQRMMELKLLFNYLSLVTLCDLLIVWVWLRGPVRTRELVRSTLRLMSRLRDTFEQCMAAVERAHGRALETHFNRGTV